MKMQFRTSPLVCSQAIEAEVDDRGIVSDVVFLGGCPGNTAGVAALAKGRPASEVIALLEGIRCGGKPTSCPAELAKALKQVLAAQKNGSN